MDLKGDMNLVTANGQPQEKRVRALRRTSIGSSQGIYVRLTHDSVKLRRSSG